MFVFFFGDDFISVFYDDLVGFKVFGVLDVVVMI